MPAVKKSAISFSWTSIRDFAWIIGRRLLRCVVYTKIDNNWVLVPERRALICNQKTNHASYIKPLCHRIMVHSSTYTVWGFVNVLLPHIFIKWAIYRKSVLYVIQFLDIIPSNRHNWLVFLKMSTLSLNQGLQATSKALAHFVDKACKHMSLFWSDADGCI